MGLFQKPFLSLVEGANSPIFLREQYLLWMREPRVSLERHPYGNAGRGGARGALWFHVSIRKASGVPLKAQVEANVHL